MNPRDVATRLSGALRHWVVRAPGTHVYLVVLFVTTTTVRSLHPVLATELLRQASTNLSQMGRSAARVLFLSAFLLDGDRWVAELVIFSAIYVPLERWVGSWRWLAVVVIGHVGATFVTTIGIWADVRSNRGAIELSRSIDVGVSYGVFAGAAFLTFGLAPVWLRWLSRLALVGVLGSAFQRNHSFTNAGHLAALLLGAATYLLLAPGLRTRPRLLEGWSWRRARSHGPLDTAA